TSHAPYRLQLGGLAVLTRCVRLADACRVAVCVLLSCTPNALLALGATVSVVPDADAFVRSAAPASNYGRGGALSVSGPAATNGSGSQNGRFDTLVRFPMMNVVASFDEEFGIQNWVVTKVRLILNETAAPDNAIFNRGVGAFEVKWLA